MKCRNLLPALANKLLAGDSTAEIRVWLAEQGENEASPLLIAEAVGMLKPSVNRELLNDWCIAASQHLYREMMGIGDFAGALKAVKQIAELSSPKSGGKMPPIDI